MQAHGLCGQSYALRDDDKAYAMKASTLFDDIDEFWLTFDVQAVLLHSIQERV